MFVEDGVMDNYNNALLLYSIYCTQNKNLGSEIKEIIACADHANHAIMTYSEFKNSIKCLLEKDLIYIMNKKIFIKNLFKEWYANEFMDKKRIYIFKVIEKIQKFLITVDTTKNIIELNITKEDFQNGINEYKMEIKAIFNSINKKKK